MDSILHGLNAAQKTAVAADAAVLQVLAPPGSGKTKTLTARVAYLIAERHMLPWNIIVCTFTVKAANEMKDRIKAFVGEDLSKQLKLGTFHSVALRYLKHYGHHINLSRDFGIADASDSKAILKRIIKKNGLSFEPGQAMGRISSRKAKGDLDSGPQRAPKGVEQQEFQRLFDEYESALTASNLLDYDDILLRCCFLLRTHPQCVSNVQAVLIDEFQDTNNIQYSLMSLFAQQRNVITIVGDPDQSIYGFRSAEIKNLTRMRKQWPDTLTINLEENYRSSGAILHAAQNIIEQDESRPPKKLQATHTYGLRPVLRRLPSAAAEADWLVSEIKRMQAVSGNMMQASDFAVLLRSAALSRPIEAALTNASIPYRMVGGMKFFDRNEVKLVVDYLRVIHQPNHGEALERIINVPPRRLGDETVKKLRDEASSKGGSLWSMILDIAQGRMTPKTKLPEPSRKGLSAFVNVILSGRKKVEGWNTEQASLVDLVSLVAQKISLQQYLKTKHAEDETFEARWANVEELMAQAADVVAPGRLEELLEADGLPQIEDLDQRADSPQDVLSVFLSNIALTASAEQKAEAAGEKVQQVTISTIHASKGLEWPVVFIPACYDGSIPHSRADDNDEERRLLYVGMTRAQALLYLSCPIKNSQREETTISTFLTHTSVGSFFEEHGPSIPMAMVTDLSVTLRRACPFEADVNKLKGALERDEDNYWPVNGEEVAAELNRWDYGQRSRSLPGFGKVQAATWTQSSDITMQQHQNFSSASTTMAAGFTSVASRYEELMEQAQLKRMDKRAEERDQDPQATKGRKRQIEGQGDIASFFAKKPKVIPEISTPPAKAHQKQALQDISNTADIRPPTKTSTAKSFTALHKPRSAPLTGRPSDRSREQHSQQDYDFLSSSPKKNEDDQQAQSDEQSAGTRPTLLPAATFHTTSMAAVASAAQPRKTLGVKRSLNGWPPPRRNR